MNLARLPAGPASAPVQSRRPRYLPRLADPGVYQPLTALRWIWERAPLDKHQKALLTALVLRADNATGEAGPRTLAELQHATGLSRATVGRAAVALVAAGLVTRERQWADDETPLASVYAVAVAELARRAAGGEADPPAPPEPTPLLPLSRSDLPDFDLPVRREPEHTQNAKIPQPAAPEPEPAKTTSSTSSTTTSSTAKTPSRPVAAPPRPETGSPLHAPAAALLAALLAAPALAPVASPLLAARVAADLGVGARIPVELAVKGVGELAAAAADSAAIGAPWPVERLCRAVRTWIAGARPGEVQPDAERERARLREAVKATLAPLPPPPPPAAVASGARAVLAALL